MGSLKKGNPFWAKQIPRWKNAPEVLRHRGILNTLQASVPLPNLTRTRIQESEKEQQPFSWQPKSGYCLLLTAPYSFATVPLFLVVMVSNPWAAGPVSFLRNNQAKKKPKTPNDEKIHIPRMYPLGLSTPARE